MLLLNVATHAAQKGQPAVYIDMETLRDVPYPDVLVRLLIDLTTELDRKLRKQRWCSPSRWRARRRLKRLRERLNTLLRDPQQAQYRLADSTANRRERRRSGRGRVGLRGRAGTLNGLASGDVSAQREQSDIRESGREASFVRTKLEGLTAEATEFSRSPARGSEGDR